VKAVVADRFDAGWRVGEHPDPIVGPDDVLVRVEASGVCFTDVHQLRDDTFGMTFPRVPGHEAVGTVLEVGAGVTSVSVGERVGAAWAQRWCGSCAACARGRYEHCPAIDLTGVTVDGGHAELCVMAAGAVERVPDGLDAAEAAPLFCAGFTVYSGIVDADLRPGERCAIVGIGGLGHLGLQYLRALGIETVAVTGSPDKRRQLEDLGADQVIVAEPDGVGEALRRLGGVDAIINTANGIDPHLLRGLRPYGRLCLVGQSHAALHVTPTDAIFGKVHIIGSSQGPRSRLSEMLALHARSGARTLVERFALNDACDGLRHVAAGGPRFRAVLVP
jgi:D-arabinose 1-dehydrogenase-like Zn-dependent alcohol dehydrogenase